jgi:anti-sigma factor ChrR (cupin superfamily)
MANQSFAGLVAGGWRTLDFVPFREGVVVHYLERGRGDGPSMAVLKYAPGARVQRHRHVDLETIVILDGVQSDENGDYATGTVVINRPGSEHSVWSDPGCVVLIQWTRPVVMLEPEASS